MTNDDLARGEPCQRALSEQVQRRIRLYDKLAKEFGWTKVVIKSNNICAQRQRYRKKDTLQQQQHNHTKEVEYIVLDCWPTTGVIGCYLKHPRQGKTQLFRRECGNHGDDDDDELAMSIFEYPRAHTDRGYHEKWQLRERGRPSSFRAKRGLGEDHNTETDFGDGDDDDDDFGQQRARKRRRLACVDGQQCRNYECTYSHPPKCFYGVHCWFQPNCWFDHTHGLCWYGNKCRREDCWFSHRNAAFYF